MGPWKGTLLMLNHQQAFHDTSFSHGGLRKLLFPQYPKNSNSTGNIWGCRGHPADNIFIKCSVHLVNPLNLEIHIVKKYILIIITLVILLYFLQLFRCWIYCTGLLDLLILSHFPDLYFMLYFMANVFNFIFHPFLIFVVLVSVTYF